MNGSHDTLGSDGSRSGPTGEPGAAADDVFDTLSHAHRRFVLAHLSQRGRSVTPRDLSASLAERSDGVTPEEARIRLHHVHLPKLEAAGFVEWDDVVRLTDAADAPLDVLELA